MISYIDSEYLPRTFRPTIECSIDLPQAKQYNLPVFYFSESTRIVNRALAFLDLGNGWSGAGTVPPKPSTLENVRFVCKNIKDNYLQLLHLDDVVPSPYGTISLYFEDVKGNELSIEIGSSEIGICGTIEGEDFAFNELGIDKIKFVSQLVEKLNTSE